MTKTASGRINARRMPRRGPHRLLLQISLATLLAASATTTTMASNCSILCPSPTLASPVAAQTVQLPPIETPASTEHHLGKIVLVELITPNLAGAKNFYAGLFGWTFRDRQTGGTDYAEALLQGRPVAGLVYRPLPANTKRSPAWLAFFSVGDVDAATQTARQQGGRVLFGPRTVPDRGREAVLADPQGAIFAIIASSSGDPPDFLAEPGEWIWSSLITRDPNMDAGFYQALFGYDVFTLPAEAGGQHLILASGNYARASANTVPASRPDMQPHWLNFIRVDDAASAAARAATLGGRILVEPRTDPDGNRMAVIADPFGAVLGLLEWRDTEGERRDQ